MEIFLWKTLATLKDRLEKLMVPSRKSRADRRASRVDRRRSVKDGVIVRLSTRVEKRRNLDRRHAGGDPQFDDFTTGWFA